MIALWRHANSGSQRFALPFDGWIPRSFFLDVEAVQLSPVAFIQEWSLHNSRPRLCL